jgi:RIO kinase 1
VNNYDRHEYDEYEELFDPMRTDRKARRKRKPQANHRPKKAASEVIDEIADTTGVEGEFTTTYHPSKYESGWLLQSLKTFYDQSLITDILALIKGGKEASVYRCKAHPSTGVEFLAAKVYRPRMFRNLRNDKLYRQGRATLTADGKQVKKTDHRIMRALGKKSAFGVQVAHTSWLMHEHTTLQRLHKLGAAVPQPFAAADNAILMGYIGNDLMAGPTLNTVELEPNEAEALFVEVIRNIELMLQNDLIHGDLSAYNILYWEGEITLIDFPQVTNSQTNSEAQFILDRDITRVCEYFAAQGVDCEAATIMNDLWEQYGYERETVPEAIDLGDAS